MNAAIEAFTLSTGAVFLGEIGDKTQLLALLLASRFRRPWPVIAGILVATLANHALAVLAGGWIADRLPAWLLPWLLGLSFIAVGLWALVPDQLEPGEATRIGGDAFRVTAVCFFLAEMGDKTQFATAALAARFDSFLPVLSGTTAGMLLADVPVVLLGASLAARLPLRPVRYLAAGTFLLLGLASLLLREQLAP